MGPNPSTCRLLLAVWGAVRGAAGAGSGPGPGAGPGISLVLLPLRLRSVPWAGGRKKRRRFLSAVCRSGRLSFPDPVVDVSVLDHRIGPVACDDDMIEDEDPDPVQQLLKLNR